MSKKGSLLLIPVVIKIGFVMSHSVIRLCFGVDFCGVNVNEHSFWKNDGKIKKQKVEIYNTQNDGTCQVKQYRSNLCGNFVVLQFGIWQ